MPPVYTIGYEGTDIDRFIATLKASGVSCLVDVRALALSRKKGFSKKTLAARLADEEIGYLHLVDLGDPKPGREAARAGLYAQFRTIYRNHLNTDIAQVALQTLISVARAEPTCLLCFERDPATCHRSIVAREMVGFEVVNLYGDDPGLHVHNTTKMPRRRSGESATAA